MTCLVCDYDFVLEVPMIVNPKYPNFVCDECYQHHVKIGGEQFALGYFQWLDRQKSRFCENKDDET